MYSKHLSSMGFGVLQLVSVFDVISLREKAVECEEIADNMKE
ncbi:MAG TPA: hypothetical protein VN580_01725 [Clostridia bacterium]|nr:hypothetical protein [Clostridia bacterium]